MTASEPIYGPPPTQPPEYLLEAKALAVALDAAARSDAAPVERRAFAAKPQRTEWNPVHLRLIREQPIAVYDPLGEVEITIAADGTIAALDDPRHAPANAEVHLNEHQAVARIALLMGVDPKDLELMADSLRTRDGFAFLRVKNKAPRPEDLDKGKFFQKQEEEPKGPPPDRIDADLNAATGAIFRFRRSPAPPPEAEPEAQA